ncbi:MAG TPA: hypothetical protein VGR45_15105 [Stellaceae bacterium]|nr:hypothetical protein [Stellaceae bacterium]
MAKSPIFGGFYQSRSKNLADNLCINLYPEIVEDKSGKSIGALYGSPGLTRIASVGLGPVRGMNVWNSPAGDILYVVSGGQLFSLNGTLSQTALGTVPNTPSGIPSASVWNNATGTLASVALPFTPTMQVPTARPWMINNGEGNQLLIGFGLSLAFQDGFGLMNQPGTPTLWQSGELDLSLWDATFFGQASGDPDNIVTIVQIRREVFCIKNGHMQIFINEGTSGFVFAELDGVYVQAGTCSPQTWVKTGEMLMGIAQLQDVSEGGATVCVMLNPYSPQRVSDHSMERIWQTYPLSAVQNAFAYAYEQEGHLWYVVTFPGEATWAYDVLESQALGVPLWTQRAAWNPTTGLFGPHQGNCFAFFNGLPLVGDSQNGNIYALDLNAQTDNGAQRRWVRSWRALPGASDDPVQFHYLRVDMQTGIGVPDGTNPQCVLTWSDDGGHSWSNEMIRAVGPPGATAQRVLFQRLGATRRNHGLDRIFKLESSDQFPVAIIGAEVR